MTDGALVALWCGVLCGGLAASVVVHRLGVPTTYVRDMLHVGPSIWVFGWPAWHSCVAPVTILLATMVAVALVPRAARRFGIVGALQRSVSGGDEGWGGLVLYTVSFALLTALGLQTRPAAAAGGLLALSWGDGIGGAVGRRFGRHHYRLGWAKPKSLEGSAAVAVASSLGTWAAAAYFGGSVAPWRIVLAGLAAAVAEALAPRASDNVAVPGVVWGVLWLVR